MTEYLEKIILKGKKMIKNRKLSFIQLCRAIIIIFPLILLLLISVVFQEKIIINSIYPESGIAKVPFNSIDGKATLSVSGIGFMEDDIIYINGAPQITTYGTKELLTCIVDSDIYQEPGTLKIMVIRKEGEKIISKSNYKELQITNHLEN